MPKNKSHSGSNKRFRVTGTGKIMRRRANRSHYNEHKASTRTRRLFDEVQVDKTQRKNIRRLINGTG